MEETKLSILSAQFRKLSPKERNEKLQALYAAILYDRGEEGSVSPDDRELLRALQRSFGISLRYEELNKGGDVGY